MGPVKKAEVPSGSFSWELCLLGMWGGEWLGVKVPRQGSGEKQQRGGGGPGSPEPRPREAGPKRGRTQVLRGPGQAQQRCRV